eukprot:748121-Hanusia_phi.AAC.5
MLTCHRSDQQVSKTDRSKRLSQAHTWNIWTHNMMETTAHPARSLMSFGVVDPPVTDVTDPPVLAAARSRRKCAETPSSAIESARRSERLKLHRRLQLTSRSPGHDAVCDISSAGQALLVDANLELGSEAEGPERDFYRNMSGEDEDKKDARRDAE